MSGSGSDAVASLREEGLILEGQGVVLTPLHFNNIYKHFEWNNDAELNRLDNELPYEKEPFSEFKKRFEEMVYHPGSQNIDFEIYADGRLIGIAYVVNISHHNKHCAVGITIGNREYWGRGCGRESLELLLEYCYKELGMHRVSAETFEYNEAWRKLVRDAGFKRDGVERDYLFRDGEYWDKEVYSMLANEYVKSRKRAA
jgi:RimJ/RimL family protein N-acetyltransferase